MCHCFQNTKPSIQQKQYRINPRLILWLGGNTIMFDIASSPRVGLLAPPIQHFAFVAHILWVVMAQTSFKTKPPHLMRRLCFIVYRVLSRLWVPRYPRRTSLYPHCRTHKVLLTSYTRKICHTSMEHSIMHNCCLIMRRPIPR